MCGILLILSKNKILNKRDCFNATKKIKTRGPDQLLKNFFFKKKLYVANSVLSITGDAKKGKNNLVNSANQNFFIAFNGEVYNWKQLSKNYNLRKIKNDTDTLVNLFDKIKENNLPSKLNGMFAYCVFDKKKKTVNVATDPQGEKKLFYFNNKDYIIISSTISSILAFLKKKPEIDFKNLNNYFNTRHFLFYKGTFYKNIKILSPGVNYKLQLKKYKIKSKVFDNPLNWISESEMKKNLSMSESEIVKKLKNILINQLKLMIPQKKYGSIFSGGIDSSLQSVLLSNIDRPDILMTIHHISKDNITKNISKFKKFVKTKLDVLKVDKQKYIRKVLDCYKITNFPFLTHDFVGKHQLAEFFRQKNCKVFFAADGADELFGGYELYKNLKWHSKKIKNHSPYSNQKTKNNTFNKLWYEAFKKYKFIKNKTERKMQASLFTDYFIQSVSVGNIGTDIMCSNSGIEPRNLFIQKNVIKAALNLPMKYKINLKSRNTKFILKPILKKIFIKYFNESLIYKKQGFSGFPNESKILLKKEKNFTALNALNMDYKKFKGLHKIRDYEWKLINLEIFLRYFNKIKKFS